MWKREKQFLRPQGSLTLTAKACCSSIGCISMEHQHRSRPLNNSDESRQKQDISQTTKTSHYPFVPASMSHWSFFFNQSFSLSSSCFLDKNY